MAELGSRIRALRKARDWTQKELAERAGLSEISIKTLEAGKYSPRGDTLDKLARAFAVPVSSLLGENADAGPFPARQLREWGVTEADVAQYRRAWPYWSEADRAKFLGNLQLLMLARTTLQAMTDEVQAKISALEDKTKQDDDPEQAAQPLAPQVAM